MTRRSGAELVVRSLQAHGIDVAVGLVGDHILPILNLLPDFGIRLLDVRQESAGVHVADGLARARGTATVCLTTGGPGLANSVAGLAVASLAGSPVVHISGHPGLSTESMGGRQQIDQIGLTAPVTKASRLVRDVRRIPTTLSEAFRVARSGRPGPVHVTIPLNVQQDSAEESDTTDASSAMPASAHADPAGVDEVLGILLRAERPLAIAGGASRWSVRPETLERFLEMTGVPLFTVDQARGLISDDHPQSLGYPDPELNETAFLISKADVILLIGAKQDFQIKFCHPPFIRADARIIQIDPDVLEIGRNRAVAVGLVGDVGPIVQQSLDAARTRVWPKWPAWLEELQGARRTYRQGLAEVARTDDAVPMHPLHVFRAAEDVLPPESTLLFDVGDFGLWGRTYMPAQGPGRWIWPGPLGHLGSSLPMAIGCQVAHPHSPVVCFAGDGAMGFHFMEIDTAVRHGTPIIVVVGNDAAFGIDRNYQLAYYGRSIGTEHRHLRFDRLAMELGGHGEHVERSADVAGALSRALASGRPAVVNVGIRGVPCPLTASRIRHDSRGARSPVRAAR
jgi:acetolactate synthase-1/2/3 large subunit